MASLNLKALKRGLVVILVLLLTGTGGFLLLVGPWPVYRLSDNDIAPLLKDNLARMEASASRSELTTTPGRLLAGWAEREIDVPVGTPLAGYAERPNDKRSMGTHDPVYVRALVLSDGRDTAALVGSDLLMTTLNLAQGVWARVGEHTSLNADNILFTTSHTHCGPGGYAPGLLGEYSLGEYDPAVEKRLIECMSQALLEAYANLAPSQLAYGHVDVPEFIYNRTNVPGVDDDLGVLLLENDAGQQCYGLRYSAHATVLPEAFLKVSAEYPGALCKRLRDETGAFCIFLGGAVGAMGPKPPAADSPQLEMQRMGEQLAEKILAEAVLTERTAAVDIACLGADIELAPMQVRPWESKEWRLSPYLANIVGLPRGGWIQAVRVGELIFLGLPYDSGGAISDIWTTAAREAGWELWVSSHCVDYCGYLSPDEYYETPVQGYDQYYEWHLMNWYGPEQEALFSVLKDHVFSLLTRSPAKG